MVAEVAQELLNFLVSAKKEVSIINAERQKSFVGRRMSGQRGAGHRCCVEDRANPTTQVSQAEVTTKVKGRMPGNESRESFHAGAWTKNRKEPELRTGSATAKGEPDIPVNPVSRPRAAHVDSKDVSLLDGHWPSRGPVFPRRYLGHVEPDPEIGFFKPPRQFSRESRLFGRVTKEQKHLVVHFT